MIFINQDTMWRISEIRSTISIILAFVYIYLPSQELANQTHLQCRFRHRDIYNLTNICNGVCAKASLIARFVGPTWGPAGADRTHVGLMLDP